MDTLVHNPAVRNKKSKTLWIVFLKDDSEVMLVSYYGERRKTISLKDFGYWAYIGASD